MTFDIDPSALVNLPCPACGQKTSMTVAEVQSNPRPRCAACGVNFAVNGRKVMEQIKAAQAKAELEQRRRGN